nr:hypothetical protein [uncultured Roseateles sp.]
MKSKNINLGGWRGFGAKPLLVLALVLTLSGCAVVPKSTLLVKGVPPLAEADVAILMGDMPSGITILPTAATTYAGPVKAAMFKRFPDILQKNGVAVRSLQSATGPLTEVPREPTVAVKGSAPYILLVKARKYVYENATRGIEFDVDLYQRGAVNRLVWETSVRLGLADGQPNIRAELFANDVLKALSQDGLVTLPKSGPIDMAGKPIETHLIWEADR